MLQNIFTFILIFMVININARIPDKIIREKIDKIKMNPEQIKKVIDMHHVWYLQAINTLMGAMGREMYLKMDRVRRKAFVNCLDDIEEDLDIREGAKCIVAAWDGKLKLDQRKFQQANINSLNHLSTTSVNIEAPKNYVSSSFIQTYSKDHILMKPKSSRFAKLSQKLGKKVNYQTQRKKQKRVFVKSKPIKIKGTIKSIVLKNRPPIQKLPFRLQLLKAKAEKFITKKTLKFNSKRMERYQRRPKRSPYRLFQENEKENDDQFSPSFLGRKIKTIPQMESFKTSQPKTMVQSLTRALTNIVRTIDPPRNGSKIESWGNSYKKLEELNKSLKSQYNRRKLRRRMLDIVMDSPGTDIKKRRVSDEMRHLFPEKGMPKFMKNAFALADTIHEHTNATKFTFLSPKFGSIVAQDKHTSTRFLSPNLFPFYKDDSAIFPIPEVLESTGMSKDDENSVMELIMEASGANSMVQDVVRILNETDLATLAPDINGVTNVITKAFENLSANLHVRQKRELRQRHYTFIKADQLRQFVGKDGLYNISNFPIDLDDYSTWSEVKKKRALINAIRKIALAPDDFNVENMVDYHLKPELQEKHRRYKRQTFEPVLEFDLLSPYAFAPLVREPLILGPIVLSPGIFSPPIESPALLSPCILSPQFMSPLIMSPYLLSPNILSASAFLPYILSPYCLSPNILQPYLFSPLILSPHVLCPDIMSPTLLSGIILNPFVLSPAVKTTSFLAIEVLSPSAFSKK